MKFFPKAISAGAVAAVMCLTTTVSAAPIPAPLSSSGVSSIEQVQYRHQERRSWKNGYRAQRENRRGWYHGQRGYRDHRRGYRRHSDGFWYPLAAFGAGAIIGGAIAPHGASTSNRHVRWCADRYKTYRASDNTYVPRVGVRAICRSPYN